MNNKLDSQHCSRGALSPRWWNFPSRPHAGGLVRCGGAAWLPPVLLAGLLAGLPCIARSEANEATQGNLNLHAADAPKPAPTMTAAEAWKIGWPSYAGPHLDWTINPTGVKLVDDPQKIRHVWQSEERLPGSKSPNLPTGNDEYRPRLVSGGAASPMLADGRVFQWYYQPSGTDMDEIERYGGLRFCWRLQRGDATFEDRHRLDVTGESGMGLMHADDVMLGVDAATGKNLWKRVLARKGNNWQAGKDASLNQRSPCILDGKVYLLGSNSRLYCLDAVSGEVLWETTTLSHKEEISARIQTSTTLRRGGRNGLINKGHGDGFDSLSPVDGKIVFRQGSGMQAVDPASGKTLWSRPDVGWYGESPVPAFWRNNGKTFALVVTQPGEIYCIALSDGTTLWKSKPLLRKGCQVAVAGDILIGSETMLKETPNTIFFVGLRLTSMGVEPLWRWSPDNRMQVSSDHNHVTVGHDGLVYAVGAKTASATGANVVGIRYDAILALEPETGKIVATMPSDVSVVHHCAPILIDDGWIFSRFTYRSWFFTRQDGQTRKDTTLPQIPEPFGHTLCFNTSYGSPVAEPYVDGRKFIRGQYRLHCIDLRANPPTETPADPIPAWAAKMAEPVKGLSSRFLSERTKALEALRALTPEARKSLTADVLRLLGQQDRLAEASAAEALTLGGWDASAVLPVLKGAILAAVEAGRGEYAASLANALTKLDDAAAGEVASALGAKLPKYSACVALRGFGDKAKGQIQAVAALLKSDDTVLIYAALEVLPAIDAKGESVPAIADLAVGKDADRAYIALEVLMAMGHRAQSAWPQLEGALARIEKGLLAERGKMKNFTEVDEDWGRMLICAGGDLGSPAIPLLRRYAEVCKNTEVKDLILGALGRQGADAVSLAKEWQASQDSAKQALAVRLIEMAVRHNTPVQVLEPFVNPLLEKGDAMAVRAAEWLLRVDGTQAKPLQVLIDLSLADKTPDDLRIEASNALSRRLIMPANGMPDDARKRGMKAIAKVIAQNKASDITILQVDGMASFCDADDLKTIQAASARVDKAKFKLDPSATPELQPPYEQ